MPESVGFLLALPRLGDSTGLAAAFFAPTLRTPREHVNHQYESLHRSPAFDHAALGVRAEPIASGTYQANR